MSFTEEHIRLLRPWIKACFVKSDVYYKKFFHSYGLKHIAEFALGKYVSNDSLIEAMKREGFKAKRIECGPNFHFKVQPTLPFYIWLFEKGKSENSYYYGVPSALVNILRRGYDKKLLEFYLESNGRLHE